MPPDALIDDPRVLALPLHEVGEPLVRPSIGTWAHPRVRSQAASRFLVRAGVAQRLRAADAALAGGSIVLAEGHRPVEVQQRFWDHRYGAVRAANPEWSDAACRAETAKFVAPTDGAPPHSTGAAVDVIVVGSDGSAVDMGSALNDPGPLMATHADVPSAARRWRDRLVAAMEGAGFVNYPHEWWHFSYGDRYWAWRTGARAALYGTVAPTTHHDGTDRQPGE